MDIEKFFNPVKGKFFEKKDDEWYNLSTGRYNKKQYSKWTYLLDYKICGTKDDINTFITYVNNETKMKEHETGCCSFISRFRNKRRLRSKNVEKLTQYEIERVRPISYNKLTTKAVIKRVIDGDTYDIVFYVEYNDLEILSTVKGGMYVEERIRLMDIDTAEKDTKEGKIVIEKVNKLLEEKGKIIWVIFEGNDKYARRLAYFYFNEEDINNKEKSLNNYLLNLRDDDGLVVTVEYHGGTKTPEKFGKR